MQIVVKFRTFMLNLLHELLHSDYKSERVGSEPCLAAISYH